MLTMPDTDIDIRERSPLALAFLGDGVLELLVRSHLVAHSRLSPGALHREAIQMVSAKAQFAALPTVEALLSEPEQDILRRGRNANKATVAKSASTQEYRAATGLEALFGWLYLRGQDARINQLFAPIWQRYLHHANGDAAGG